EPSILWIDLSAIVQGVVFGLFAVSSLQYVEELAEDRYQHTAVALFSATTYGAGNWLFTLTGGFIMDALNIYDTYLFFALISFAGLLFWLLSFMKKAAR
ncbi:MAG TPA: MFS transporter, partial [Bacillales bacterium]|nr:MFS transporter [Bacillales bacterium]